MPSVQDILANKGGAVFTVPPTMDVLGAVHLMNEHRCGSLVVVDRQQVVGIFTERDVLKALAQMNDLRGLTVRDVMTRDVITVNSTTELDDVSEQMKVRRVRHLPVVDGDLRLCGLISIGDLNAWHVEMQARHIDGLNEYIYGRS